MAVVPDNANNTVTAATIVIDTESGAVVPASSRPAPINASRPQDGVRMEKKEEDEGDEEEEKKEDKKKRRRKRGIRTKREVSAK